METFFECITTAVNNDFGIIHCHFFGEFRAIRMRNLAPPGLPIARRREEKDGIRIPEFYQKKSLAQRTACTVLARC